MRITKVFNKSYIYLRAAGRSKAEFVGVGGVEVRLSDRDVWEGASIAGTSLVRGRRLYTYRISRFELDCNGKIVLY